MHEHGACRLTPSNHHSHALPFTWLQPCRASRRPEAIAVGSTEAPSKAKPAPSDAKSSTHLLFSAKTRPFTWLRPCPASRMPEAVAVGSTEAPNKAKPATSDAKSSTHLLFPQKQGRRKVAGMTPERARRRHSDRRPKTEAPRPSSKANANKGRGSHHPT